MKKIILAITLLFMGRYSAFPEPASLYVGASAGVSVKGQEESKDAYRVEDYTSPFIGLNIGTGISRFKIEAEYIYRYETQKLIYYGNSDKISTNSFMGNLYFDVFNFPTFKLFVNGGLGYTLYGSNAIANDGGFSYDAGVGVSFMVGQLYSIDVGYRYFNMGDAKINNTKSTFFTNDLYIGFRFGFY